MAKNSFFQFKQFIINQDKSAMKVCTDACVLGAWADIEGAEKILDIGTGTGLLALMVAQRNSIAKIDAVELDTDAFSQAVGNIEESKFHDQIKVINSSIQNFKPDYQYDCIITNPPFFQSDLLSPKTKKNLAHHAVSLSFDELLESLDKLLTNEGRFNILLPVDEAEVFLRKAVNSDWFITKKLTLYHHKNKKSFRQLMTFRRKHVVENQTFAQDLYIYNEDGKSYDSEFKELMKDFYMIF